jgi:tight adherence protein C
MDLNPILVFAAALAGFFIVINIFDTSRDEDLQERLEKLDTITGATMGGGAAFQEELRKPFAERIIMPVVRRVSEMVNKQGQTDYVTTLRNKLAQAGYPGGLRPQEFIAVQILVAVVCVLSAALVGFLFFAKKGPQIPVLFALAGLVLGLLVPRYYLEAQIGGRRHRIQCQLADILDLLTVSVEAGLGFDAALAKVTEKMPGPLPEEFDSILREIRMGKGRKEALRDAGERIGVHDVDVFFSAIIQAEQLGVSLGKVLRVQSDQLRTKRRLRAEEKAMEAPIKMMLPLVGCIFPVILIVLLAPAILQAYQTFDG